MLNYLIPVRWPGRPPRAYRRGMSTDPAPQPPPDPKAPPTDAPVTGMFAHIFPPVSPADVERFKAEHAARMKESAKNWPGRKRSKRRGK